MADEVRHSQALEAELIRDPELVAQTEVHNGLKQFEAVVKMVEGFLTPSVPSSFAPPIFNTFIVSRSWACPGMPVTGVLRASRFRGANTLH